jgi:hypothetical protein
MQATGSEGLIIAGQTYAPIINGDAVFTELLVVSKKPQTTPYSINFTLFATSGEALRVSVPLYIVPCMQGALTGCACASDHHFDLYDVLAAPTDASCSYATLFQTDVDC